MSPLNPVAMNSQILIQITDTHLMADPDSTFLGISPEQMFYAVMQDIQQNYPQAKTLIHTGDLAQEAQSSTYERYLNYINKTPYRSFQVPGNHDDLDLFPFEQPLPQPAVIDIDPWAVILLNSTVLGRVDGFLQNEQLQFLDQQLTQLKDKFVILACHHHPIDMHSHWIDQHKLKNTIELMQILQGHNNIRLVLCGHVHQDSINIWNNITFFSTPSTCVQFKPLQQNFTLDQVAPGYRSLCLNTDGTFTTQVHRLEHMPTTIDQTICGY